MLEEVNHELLKHHKFLNCSLLIHKFVLHQKKLKDSWITKNRNAKRNNSKKTAANPNIQRSGHENPWLSES